MSRVVLWGAHSGDVQYASRDYWRRNIPFGVTVVTVDNAAFFDVGHVVEFGPVFDPIPFTVCGKIANQLGVVPFSPRKRPL